jgi:hypothetical protein
MSAYQRKTEDEFEILGFYTQGWELVTTETNRKDVRDQLKCYRENEPGVPFKWRKKRVPINA